MAKKKKVREDVDVEGVKEVFLAGWLAKARGNHETHETAFDEWLRDQLEEPEEAPPYDPKRDEPGSI